MKHSIDLTPFTRAVSTKTERLRKAAKGRKVFGWFCTYTPIEMIHAAGFLPARISGGMVRIQRSVTADIVTNLEPQRPQRQALSIPPQGRNAARCNILARGAWESACESTGRRQNLEAFSCAPRAKMLAGGRPCGGIDSACAQTFPGPSSLRSSRSSRFADFVQHAVACMVAGCQGLAGAGTNRRRRARFSRCRLRDRSSQNRTARSTREAIPRRHPSGNRATPLRGEKAVSGHAASVPGDIHERRLVRPKRCRSQSGLRGGNCTRCLRGA